MILRKSVLRSLRQLTGDTQEDAAKRIGVSLFTIQKWESTREGVSDRSYPKVLKSYNVTEEEAQKIAQRSRDDWKAAQKQQAAEAEEARVKADKVIGVTEEGYNITLSKMTKWLIRGTPIKPTHGKALIAHIEKSMALWAPYKPKDLI